MVTLRVQNYCEIYLKFVAKVETSKRHGAGAINDCLKLELQTSGRAAAIQCLKFHIDWA